LKFGAHGSETRLPVQFTHNVRGRRWPVGETVAVQILYGDWIIHRLYTATSALFMVVLEIAHGFFLCNESDSQGALRLFSLGEAGPRWCD
jgi:hypothetical protein